ncbi:MAG: class I SAM-dependent methyltransferase [Candidatus Lokiarchaeota archaeon]|nr:class I SAM-dependent methyltransferase [Candidatus Harpocratesius repetitus]
MAKSSHYEETKKYWNKKAPSELAREEYDIRKKIHTDLLWREIRRALNGNKNLSILDAGAGPGRFSIPLAQEGHSVVHLDISGEMIEIAKNRLPKTEKCDITFVQQSICEPLPFPDQSFDLVLCLDSPLSYCVNNYESAFAELVRVAKKTVVLCVVNRFGAMMEDAAEFDFQYFGKLKTQWDLLHTGNLNVNEEIKQFEPNLMPSWHGFTPKEVKDLIKNHSGKIIRISAPGTFTRCMSPEIIEKVYQNEEVYQDFLDFLEEFDSKEDVLGVGGIYAGGLLVRFEI